MIKRPFKFSHTIKEKAKVSGILIRSKDLTKRVIQVNNGIMRKQGMILGKQKKVYSIKTWLTQNLVLEALNKTQK